MLISHSQAFVIAIPSSFIPKTLYIHQNGGLSGYINASYAFSPVSGLQYRDNEQNCYYKVD